MAGEWLKFEKATPDKPEVFAIAARLDLDPDAVVGKLIRVWSWFDTHTVDGNGRSVTPALLDRIASVTGFTRAMEAEGWIVVTPAGVSLPNFDRHTGETAKGRALGAKRSAEHRAKSNGDSVTPSVTAALPREEKKREEQQQEPKAVVQRTADRFEDFWAEYPVKKGRPPAEAKWRAKGLDAIADQLIAHVRMMKVEDRDSLDGYAPHGSTYVNGERWHDEPKGRTTGPPAAAPQSKTLTAIQRLEGMKHGLADSGTDDRLPKTPLLGFGPDPGNGFD
jgi:hypothetical protein